MSYVYRCKCGKCSLEFVVQHEECRCCMEIDRCRERMAQVEKDEECVTSHPGFESLSESLGFVWLLQR